MAWQPGSNNGLSGFDLAQGSIPGAFPFNQLGYADSIDSADVPLTVGCGFEQGMGDIYTYSTTADIDTVSSNNAASTQLLVITGLDADFKWTIQTATLNGQNKVTLTTPLIRLIRLLNLSATSLGASDLVFGYVDGAITAGVPDDPATVRNMICGQDNISQTAIFTTPSDRTTWFLSSPANVGSAAGGTVKSVDLELKIRLNSDITGIGSFFLAAQITLTTEGTGSVSLKSDVPAIIPPKTDIEWQCVTASANNTRVNCGIFLFLQPTK